MQNSPMVSYLKDADGRYIFMNDRCSDLFRLPVETLLGKTDEDLWDPETAKRIQAIDADVLRTEEPFEYVNTTTVHGVEHHWFTVKFVIHDLDGRKFLAGQSLDITGRVAAEEGLRLSEERFHFASRATCDVIWDCDYTDGSQWYNENLQILFGYPLEVIEWSIEWWKERIHPEDRRSVLESVDAAIATRSEFWRSEYRFQRYDGSYATITDRGYVIYDEANVALRMIGAMTDITERRQVREELQQAHDKLEARVHERTVEIEQMVKSLRKSYATQKRFVADASHDLRSPLTVIQAEVDLLLRGGIADPEERASLERVSSETRRLTTLASDLLMLATFDSERFVGTWSTVRLDEMILEAVSSLSTLARSKGITWGIRIDDPIEILCDSSAMHRALSNVLENAVKYSHNDGRIDLQLDATDDGIFVVVIDHGPGIPPEALPYIFDRFFRSDPARDRTQGSGLGLSIVQSVIEAHGGSVMVASELGEGTTVRLMLPGL